MRIRDRKNSDPGSGMEKVGSWNGKNIPDPQHWQAGKKSIIFPAFM